MAPAKLTIEEIRSLVAKLPSATDKEILGNIVDLIETGQEVPYDVVFDAIAECIDPDLLERIGVDLATISQVIDDMTPPPKEEKNKKK